MRARLTKRYNKHISPLCSFKLLADVIFLCENSFSFLDLTIQIHHHHQCQHHVHHHHHHRRRRRRHHHHHHHSILRPVFERFARVLLNPLSASQWPLQRKVKKRNPQTIAECDNFNTCFGFTNWKLRIKKANSTLQLHPIRFLPPWTCRPTSSSSQSFSTKMDLNWLRWRLSCHVTPWAPNTGRLSLAMRLFLGRSSCVCGDVCNMWWRTKKHSPPST